MKKLLLLIPFIALLCVTTAYGQVTELPKIETVQQLPKDFQKFFRKFTQNRETQIALIKTPLIDHYYDFDGKKKEHINKENLKKQWGFLTNDYFIENLILEEEWCGYWRKIDDTHIAYIKGLCEAGYSFEYYFEKIKNTWFLTEVVCNNF